MGERPVCLRRRPRQCRTRSTGGGCRPVGAAPVTTFPSPHDEIPAMVGRDGPESPLGIALLVGGFFALAVALAVVIDQSGGEDEPPPTEFRKDEQEDRLHLQEGADRVAWGDLWISSLGTADGKLCFAVNGAPGSGTGDSPCPADALAGGILSSEPQGIASGSDRALQEDDFVAFCTTGAEATDIHIAVVHSGSNILLYETTFETIGTC